LQTFYATERISAITLDLPKNTSSGGNKSIGSVREVFLVFGEIMIGDRR
jgi:hypothetical protein